MDTNQIAQMVLSAVQENPSTAQDLVSDPSGMISKITGATEGFDIAGVVQQVLKLASAAGLDLSHVDLSKLDLSQIDVSKLDLAELGSLAKSLNIDVTKLNLGGMDLGSMVGGLLGGLFGGK